MNIYAAKQKHSGMRAIRARGHYCTQRRTMMFCRVEQKKSPAEAGLESPVGRAGRDSAAVVFGLLGLPPLSRLTLLDRDRSHEDEPASLLLPHMPRLLGPTDES